MKVLYLASRTPEVESLSLEVEITGVQRRLRIDTAEDTQFIFLPDVKLEDVPLEITRHKPDVLHISVHGAEAGLSFATADGRLRPLSPEQLAAFLPPDRMPRLVFLNACESHAIAKTLAANGLVAIGTRAPITNRAAVAAATLLYDRLLHGYTVRETFRAVSALVGAFEASDAGLVMEAADEALADRPLVQTPRLVARLSDDEVHLRGQKVRFKLGFAGCPASTTQVCFFTDDPSFLGDGDEDEIEESLTEVVRDTVRGGEMWTETNWEVDGDCRVAACGITAAGATFSASGLLSDMLASYAQSVEAPPAYLAALPNVLEVLRRNNGAGLADWRPRGKLQNVQPSSETLNEGK